MKKSSFVALVMGTISGLLFSLGMCMALLPEWNAFNAGVICGATGFILGIATIIIWRKMTNKAPIRISAKSLGAIITGIIGALVFGTGMCLCMVFNQMVWGIIIGIVGIVILLSLIPLTVGLKD